MAARVDSTGSQHRTVAPGRAGPSAPTPGIALARGSRILRGSFKTLPELAMAPPPGFPGESQVVYFRMPRRSMVVR